MVRQTRNYMKGAFSATALLGVAIVAFVLLVSLQTLRDWPLAGLGGGDGEGEVGSVVLTPAVAGRTGGADGTAGDAGSGPGGGTTGRGGGGSADGRSTGGAPAAGTTPVAGAPDATGGGDSGAAGGGSASSGGGGSVGGGEQQPGGGGDDDEQSVSETVTGTVNETVAGVDEATGGALGKTGVTKTTEEAVSGVAGPESTAGKTVDQTVDKTKDTVDGLLGTDD